MLVYVLDLHVWVDVYLTNVQFAIIAVYSKYGVCVCMCVCVCAVSKIHVRQPHASKAQTKEIAPIPFNIDYTVFMFQLHVHHSYRDQS